MPKITKMSTRQKSQKLIYWGKISLPAVARSGAKSEGWDIFRRPLDNFDQLTERAKTRNRQTQTSAKDLPFQVQKTQGDWSLVKLVDGTFGWLPSKHVKQVKSSNYWGKVKYFKQNKALPSPTLDAAKLNQFLDKLKAVPYLWGGTTKAGMDCSAFTQKLFFELSSTLLPRNSREQKKLGKVVKSTDISGLDILFFVHKTTGRHHVGVYWNDEVVHFCLDKKGLSTEPLVEMKKRYRHTATRRILNFSSVKKSLIAPKVNSEALEKIKNAKDIHIVGVSGTESSAVALFLQKMGVKFTAHDFSSEKRFKRSFVKNHFGYSATKREKMLKSLLKLKDLKFQQNYLQGIENADLIFVSQNWEAYSPNQKLKRLFAKSSELFATITQLYFQLFPGKIIAITGTNGKSTTAKLVAEIMKSSRQASRQNYLARRSPKGAVWFTGNDRRNIQILDCLDKWTSDDWLTVEVSNRQLKFPFGRSPDIGVILNVTKNHLDEYDGSFAAYKAGKFSLIKGQNNNQVAILNADDLSTRQFIKSAKGVTLPYSTQKKLPARRSPKGEGVSTGVYLKDGWIVESRVPARRSPKGEDGSTGKVVTTKICSLDKIKLLGDHNLSNALAAVAATRTAGVKISTIQKVLGRFRGIPQRLELIFEKNGVRFVNDSASTTPESTIAAIQSFEKGPALRSEAKDGPALRSEAKDGPALRSEAKDGSVNLICGGDAKGMDYTALISALRRNKVRTVVLESPLANILRKSLKNNLEVVKTLQDAIKISAKNAQMGDSVLLSPAATWFNYFDKKIPLGGRGFEKFVRTLV
jgi:UDP-N-acetylmuramoylalanine--D-glutamate ligase